MMKILIAIWQWVFPPPVYLTPKTVPGMCPWCGSQRDDDPNHPCGKQKETNK